MIRNNLYMIAAITDKSRAIGYNNSLLFNLPSDLKYFKETTSGHTILMGRKTYESLPIRPLPNRTNIVISGNMESDNGVIVFKDINSALNYIDETGDTVFVCGGVKIYQEFLPYARKLYLTIIEEESLNKSFNADTFFPDYDKDIYEVIYEKKENENNINYKFVVFENKK